MADVKQPAPALCPLPGADHEWSLVSMSSALLAAGGRQRPLGILDNLDDR